MHSTCCLLRCVGAWGCCVCSVPSAQRLRSTCTHPSSRRAASAGRIASVTSQWVAAGLVLPRRSSEWSSRGGTMALTRGVSSTSLVFLIAIVLRVHIPLSSRATGHSPPFAANAASVSSAQSPRHHPRPHTHPFAAAVTHTHEQLRSQPAKA
ncbi:hypothetical protein TcCL_NonESM07480 [Trypanosoma cruzi]|nr:hypothetical protein TcCL_NonESM07480 [Trypanosoma cruzi]